jgi:hypothetical protein
MPLSLRVDRKHFLSEDDLIEEGGLESLMGGGRLRGSGSDVT